MSTTNVDTLHGTAIGMMLTTSTFGLVGGQRTLP
jgi:hypothetical protein